MGALIINVQNKFLPDRQNLSKPNYVIPFSEKASDDFIIKSGSLKQKNKMSFLGSIGIMLYDDWQLYAIIGGLLMCCFLSLLLLRHTGSTNIKDRVDNNRTT